jgi:hypothetical protein
MSRIAAVVTSSSTGAGPSPRKAGLMRESPYLAEIRRLDPVRDQVRIVHLHACYEFPFDTTREHWGRRPAPSAILGLAHRKAPMVRPRFSLERLRRREAACLNLERVFRLFVDQPVRGRRRLIARSRIVWLAPPL